MTRPLRIGIPLFNIYLNEADELSRRLMTEVAEWAMELHRPIGEEIGKPNASIRARRGARLGFVAQEAPQVLLSQVGVEAGALADGLCLGQVGLGLRDAPGNLTAPEA